MSVKNRMVRLLKMDDKGRGLSQNALAALFRTILYDTDVEEMEWNGLVEKYLNNLNPEESGVASSRSTLKGNITKEFSKDEIAWKVFCKALRVLGYERVTLELTLHRLDTVSLHSLPCVLKNKDAGAVLANVFKTLRLELGVGPLEWLRLMDTLLADPALGLPEQGSERHSVKSKVDKELTTDRLTWKMFMRGMRFLGVHHLEIKVICLRDEEETEHLIQVANVSNRMCFRRRYEEVSEKQRKRRMGFRSPTLVQVETK